MAPVLLFCYYWWIFNNKYLSFYHSSSGTLQRVTELHFKSFRLQFLHKMSHSSVFSVLWWSVPKSLVCRNQVFQLQQAAIFLGCTLGLWYTGRAQQRIWRGSGGERKRFSDRLKLFGFFWPLLYSRVFWKMWTSHSYSAMCLIFCVEI